MPRPAPTRVALQSVLQRLGTATVHRMAAETGLTAGAVEKCLANNRSQGTAYFRVAAWLPQTNGRGGRETPVYALGPGDDVPRPASRRRETQRRYADANRDAINARRRAIPRRRPARVKAKVEAAPVKAEPPPGPRTAFAGGVSLWASQDKNPPARPDGIRVAIEEKVARRLRGVDDDVN